MANYVDKSKVSVAAKPIHRFPMHQQHLTTSNFMQFDCSFAKEIIPKTKVKYNHQTFIRTFPLKRPIMGSVQVHNSAYFVPFRTVWQPWTDYITDSPHNTPDGTMLINAVPMISNSIIQKVFNSSDYTTSVGINIATITNEPNFDYIAESNNQFSGHNFTAFGRHSYKILTSLGMKPNLRRELPNFKMSALPLLTLCKVYLDYYFPNQYAHTGIYAVLDGIFQRHFRYDLTDGELKQIFEFLYVVSYDSDYFVSAFDNPLGPSDNVGSTDYEFLDISLFNDSTLSRYDDAVFVAGNQTPYIDVGVDNGGQILTQYADSTLRALTNYIRRHQLAGSRSLERMLSEFGVALTADKLQRCYKLSSEKFPLEVGEVLSTADTINQNNGAALGDYAGRAVAYNGNLNFDFESDEYGYLFVISTIVPDIAYSQGLNRNVLHKFRLDFFTPEFDGLGTQPVTMEELFIGFKRPVAMDALFGFAPRYAEYKTAYDIIDGDFVINTINTGLLGFSTQRLFRDKFLNEDGDALESDFNTAHSLDFILANDFSQYNRIFFDTDDDADKFIVVHRSNFELSMPAVPLYDFYEFDDGSKDILLNVNGVKSN